jgi:hypothetical protein
MNQQVRKIGWLVGGRKMAGYENSPGFCLAAVREFLLGKVRKRSS